MYQNSQLTELLAPHQNYSNNTDIARKYGYSTAPEELPRGIAATIKIQLTPHDGITSYPTTTSTGVEDVKYHKRRLTRNNIHKTLRSHVNTGISQKGVNSYKNNSCVYHG